MLFLHMMLYYFCYCIVQSASYLVGYCAASLIFAHFAPMFKPLPLVKYFEEPYFVYLKILST